jgi:LuxR family maltose regulon positive regulatory protein
MPADVEGPESALVTAAQRLASAEPDEAMKHLERAAASDAADSSPHQSVPMRLSLALLGTVLAGQQQDDARVLRAAEAAEACIALAPPERVADHPELRAIVLLSRGTSQSRSGALREAVATLTEGLKAAASAGGEGSRLACLEQLALANAYLGRLQEAARVATQAAQLAGRRGPPPQPSFIAAVVLAWVAAERWTVATAWRHLHAAETALAGCAESAVDSLATVAFALVRSRLLSGRGELSGAVRALDAIQTPDSQLPSWLQQEGVLTKARLAVAMGHLDEALAAVAALDDHRGGQAAIVTAAALVARDDAQQAGDLVAPVVKATDLPAPVLIEAWLIMAVAASDRDDAGTVRASVGQALALAAPDSHRRVFHQAGPRLRQLMRADSALAASYQALGHPPSAASGRRPSSLYAHAPIESLSERELEVLKHLAAMLGTEEIADTMYLSVNTVKTHVRGILRKLAASRRNEAVRRARELGIV